MRAAQLARYNCLLLLAFAHTATSFKVFIDGSAGTTGLQVRDRLKNRPEITLIDPPDSMRKDESTRKEFMLKSDVTILCLPDSASSDSARWLTESGDTNTVLIDASTAFRVDPDFTYGFAELCEGQREAIKKSKRISNPGCYPTGFIALTRPLVSGGLLPEGSSLTVNAISGYSGGGKQLMEIHEAGEAEPWGAYGFNLAHKHLPEMSLYSKLGKAPIFQPQVGSFPQGMVVSVPLHYGSLAEGVTGEKIWKELKGWYKDSKFVKVMELESGEYLERGAFLRPDTLMNTNKMELFVFANDSAQQCVLCARLDNLGKGASGAAVQNMNLALGLDEDAGL
ncbi:hypothetical protein TrVE_jg11005 [Triparma verrucosa]|uniref:Semialdehyde dehydrogenase NAD-binding domain-containing protein n=1 Tax=Triparma verrucosa TaxID=1606542 RepID=A0A9W7EXD1_9STRA|nr:hypothetical protein TrVE_jg11005 [Triparma verrucosa]